MARTRCSSMDEAEFDVAVATAKSVYGIVMYLLRDPPASLANLARREFRSRVIPAWIAAAEDRDQRSRIAAEAVNRIDLRLNVEAPTRRGPHPEKDADRNIAALAAMWFLSERLGLEPTMRNITQRKSALPKACSKGGSVCDAVGVAMGWNYKNAERVWTDRAKIFRRHSLLIVALWAELPSATLLGIPLTPNK